MLIVSALAYGYIDYAMAVLRAPVIGERIDLKVRESLSRSIHLRGRGFRPFLQGNVYLHTVFEMLSRAFRPSTGGWVSGSQGLGSRRRGPFWT
jgi:hypothetical protein